MAIAARDLYAFMRDPTLFHEGGLPDALIEVWTPSTRSPKKGNFLSVPRH